MCVAYPGQVLEIIDDMAVLDADAVGRLIGWTQRELEIANATI